MKLICASVIAPMDRPPIRGGAILVDGPWIAAIGSAADLIGQNTGVEVLDLGDVVMTPGLVNAHTHLELSDTARPQEPGRFVDWLIGLIGHRSALGEQIHQASAAAARRGAAESIRCGVACVGDITRFAAATRSALAGSPLRVVSFGEVQAMAGRRHLLDGRIAEATDLSHDDWQGSSRLMIGVSPHAPYSVEPHAFAACLQWAIEHSRPISTHLAETPAEAEFLAAHAGELRELWQRLGDWSDDVPRSPGGPVRLAQEIGLLSHPTLLAHVNYVDDAELDLLAAGRASVVWCPRTHEYFGHRNHRFREMMARGVRVCLGTDSRASAPDLNVLKEARLLHKHNANMGAHDLWKMVTLTAAEALGVGRWIGALSPGRWADLAIWPLLEASDPLEAILRSKCLPRQTWIAGEQVAEST